MRHVIADGRALPPDHPQATGRAAFATSGATAATAAPSAPAAPARQPRPASATRGGSGRFGVPVHRPASATCSRAPPATAAELLGAAPTPAHYGASAHYGAVPTPIPASTAHYGASAHYGAVPTPTPASTAHAPTATAPGVTPTASTGRTTKLTAAAGTANAVAGASAAASANDTEPDAQLLLEVRGEVESLQQCMHRALQRATRTLRGRLLPSKPTTLEDSGVPGAAVGAQQIRWLAQVCRVMLPHCLVCVFDPLSQDLESRYSPWTVLTEDAQALGVERDERLVLEKFDPYAAVAAAVEAAP